MWNTLKATALVTALLAGTAALAFAQSSSSSIGAGGSTAGNGSASTALGTGGSSSNWGSNGTSGSSASNPGMEDQNTQGMSGTRHRTARHHGRHHGATSMNR